VHHLRKPCDEVLGRKFVAEQFEKKSITKDAQWFVYDHEYILILKPKVKSVALSG
jgi:hypothetical protein